MDYTIQSLSDWPTFYSILFFVSLSGLALILDQVSTALTQLLISNC